MNESLRKYLLYASHAIFDSNEGSILDVCNSDKEARREAKALDLGEVVCYSYAVSDDKLIDEQMEWVWTPMSGFSDRDRHDNPK